MVMNFSSQKDHTWCTSNPYTRLSHCSFSRSLFSLGSFLIIKCVRSILLSPWRILTHYYLKSVELSNHRGITNWLDYEAQSIIVHFPHGLLRIGSGKQFQKEQSLKKKSFGHVKWMRSI